MRIRIEIRKPGEGRIFEDLGPRFEPALTHDPEEPISIVIHPTATKGGRPVVYLRTKATNGKQILIRVTGRIWDAVQGAIIGSEMRLDQGDDPIEVKKIDP